MKDRLSDKEVKKVLNDLKGIGLLAISDKEVKKVLNDLKGIGLLANKGRKDCWTTTRKFDRDMKKLVMRFCDKMKPKNRKGAEKVFDAAVMMVTMQKWDVLTTNEIVNRYMVLKAFCEEPSRKLIDSLCKRMGWK